MTTEPPVTARALLDLGGQLRAERARREKAEAELRDTSEVLADFRAWHERDIKEIARLTEEAVALTCAWTYRDDYALDEDTWHTGCGRVWQYTTGGPAENHQVYCHACGGRITLDPVQAVRDALGLDDSAELADACLGPTSTHARRYCEMCDIWLRQRECPKCGAETVKAQEPRA